MSVKKQVPSLCKLYSFYEEIPEEFLNETDVDSCFYQNVYDNSQSRHRILRVSKGSNKKSFAVKLFQFFELKTQQHYILQDKVNISKGKLTFLVDSLGDFLKTFDHASKSLQIPLPKSKVDIRFKKSKYNLFARYYNDIFEHPPRQIRLSFRFGIKNSCVFTIEKIEPHSNHNILTEIVNLNFLQNSSALQEPILRSKQVWNNWDQLRCVAYSPLIVGVTKALLSSLGTCIVPMQSVRENFACTERIFILSAETIINARNARLCARCAVFLLKIKQILFSCRLVKGFTILRRLQNQFKVFVEMRIVLAIIVSTENNENLLTVM